MTAADRLDGQQLRELAAHFKAQHPETYLAVTGLPPWWDQVGQEFSQAEAKWRRYVQQHAVTDAEVGR